MARRRMYAALIFDFHGDVKSTLLIPQRQGLRKALQPDAGRAESAPLAVRDLCRRARLTRQEFAAKVGALVETIRNWEQGKRVPQVPAPALLAVIAHAPVSVFAAVAKDNHRSPVCGRKSGFEHGLLRQPVRLAGVKLGCRHIRHCKNPRERTRGPARLERQARGGVRRHQGLNFSPTDRSCCASNAITAEQASSLAIEQIFRPFRALRTDFKLSDEEMTEFFQFGSPRGRLIHSGFA